MSITRSTSSKFWPVLIGLATLSLLARNQDGLITANLKTRLLTDGTIPGTRIKVVTEAGVVYLMGRVTHHEANLAVAQAQQIGGVQRIVKLFEYLD